MMKRLKYGVFGIVSLLFSISFGYCDNIYNASRNVVTLNIYEGYFNFNSGTCLVTNSYMSVLSIYKSDGTFIGTGINGSNGLICFDFDGYITSSSSTSRNYYYYVGLNNLGGSSSCPTCPDCPSCPSINTGEILSGYILESEIDNLYCENHGYCPIIDTGDIENQWSALYINDIQHVGAGLINLTIPEEFERDYIYTGNGEELDIDVKGYNVDTAYIDGLITTQRTLPNNTDFNNTISGLLPLFVPGIVIIFFLYFIFRFIKKVF